MDRIENNIRYELRNKAKSIKWLAEELGLTDVSLHRMFKRGDYKFSTLAKIREILQMDMYRLIGIPPTQAWDQVSFKDITGTKVEVDMGRYEGLRLEVRRLRVNLMELQDRYMALCDKYGEPHPVIKFRYPDAEDDILI